MTYLELYNKADHYLNNKKITLGEHEKMIEPLNQKIRKWIPCNERLPFHDGRYLITNNQIGCWNVDIDIFANGKWMRPADKHLAWMPLPEPYKPESEE